MTDQELTGTVALVTGASSGIGEATARELARRGAAVAIGARRKERLDALAQEIEQAGGRALAIQTDVTDEDQARRLVAETVSSSAGWTPSSTTPASCCSGRSRTRPSRSGTG